jgi:purine-binding chemotaxis protein CheW
MEKTMTQTEGEPRTATSMNNSSDGADEPLTDTIQMLEFIIDNEHFAIDLAEVKEVVSEMILTGPCTPGSIVKPFIKRNRKETIVFDLNRCLNIQSGGRIKGKKTEMLMLSDKIADSALGLLISGISSIKTMEYPWKRTEQDPRARYDTPIYGIIRKTGQEEIIWINIRSLVKNCVVSPNFTEYRMFEARIA